MLKNLIQLRLLFNKWKENKELTILPRVFCEISSYVKKIRLKMRPPLLLSNCFQNARSSFVLLSIVGIRESLMSFTTLLLNLTTQPCLSVFKSSLGCVGNDCPSFQRTTSHDVLHCLSDLPMVGR